MNFKRDIASMASIASYWDKQARIWREEKDEEWNLPETKYWIEYFRGYHKHLKGRRVLEIGTASGYFANILTLAGFEVTAIDISAEMIAQAREVSSSMNLDINYIVMDAQNLVFKEDSFDMVFTRLMTWIVPDTERFYKSCFKVLNRGGVLINFDGDFGNIKFSCKGHEKYPADIMQQANTIKQQLDISNYSRPDRDISLLNKIGFREINPTLKAEDIILHKDNSELFSVTAVKPF